MKSQRAVQLQRCNNLLKADSWRNYQKLLRTLCNSLVIPQAKEVLGFLANQDFNGLMDYADCLSSTEYATATEHRLCNQIAALIRKYPYPPGIMKYDPEAKATETFMKSERKCSLVNRRFSLYETLRSPHEQALQRARSWISYTLGEISLPEIYEQCDFGNGASLGVHGDATNFARKLLAKEWTVTPGAYYYAKSAIGIDVHIFELLNRRTESRFFSHDIEEFNQQYRKRVSIVSHNKIAFVPKTAKTLRTIAVEPLLNGYLQKGIDVFLRKRLKRVGIDLSDQTLNRGLALFGSIPGLDEDPYVTIDLSSASDSISIGLCRNMLPPDWFYLLDSARSTHYLLNGEIYRYKKFVTMGNGFCFPLETLIFASLCEAASSERSTPADYSVYGDDIIVRQSLAGRVLELLRICGFSANTNKTFIRGPFRESCGSDWYEGKDVRPMSLDYALDSVQNVIKFYNLSGSKDSWLCLFSECRDFVLSLIPPELRFSRPFKGNVDTALEVPMDVFLASPFSRWHRSMQTWSWIELRTAAIPDKDIRRSSCYDLALMRGAMTGIQSSTHFTYRRKTSTKLVRVSPSSGWSLYLPGTVFSRCDTTLFADEFTHMD